MFCYLTKIFFGSKNDNPNGMERYSLIYYASIRFDRIVNLLLRIIIIEHEKDQEIECDLKTVTY